MKNSLYFSVLLIACALVACDPQPEPQPQPKDGLHHDSMTVTDELFLNPERGFHRSYEIHTPNPQPLTDIRMKNATEAGYTLVHIDYYMEDYRDTLIDESYLDVIRQNMEVIRKGGVKCIIRFAYTSSESQTPHEAKEELVLQHIAQLKPILQENADVIFTMEAGFVGVWGEWYYTTYFKQSPSADKDFEGRRHVLDALLDALPKERMICVRTPRFKMKCYGWTLADTLTRAEAYSGSPKARLAAHDDAFMADGGDLGTFTTEEHRAYWNAETKYTIFGGESCPPGSIVNCENSTKQMIKLHMAYLNIDYYKGTINKWHNGGCLEEFRKLIGYRFEGRDIAYTENPKAGEELKVKLSLVNVGYTSPKNPRDIEMLLINADDAKDVTIVKPESDPRFWFPDELIYVEAAFKPKAGTYKLYLNLPDPMPSLRDDPRYAIRLANENCWDEKTGYNYLTTIVVE